MIMILETLIFFLGCMTFGAMLWLFAIGLWAKFMNYLKNQMKD